MKRSNSVTGLSRLIASVVVMLVTLTLVACSPGVNSHINEPTQSIVEIAQSDDQFSTLVAALSKADLVGALNGDGPLTVFAPTNAAFASLASGLGVQVTDLLDLPDLKDILLYHVASGQLTGEKLLESGSATTLEGNALAVSKNGDAVVVNSNSTVTTADVLATNGVIHIIDAVLLPPKPSIVEIAQDNANFSTLVAAVTKADLVGALSGQDKLTVFAPTNAAFEALATSLNVQVTDLLDLPNLKDILLYHVASGSLNAQSLLSSGSAATLQGRIVTVAQNGASVSINGNSTVSSADIEASNGIVHVIDTVLLPPTKNIVEVAQGDPQFSTLVAAVVKADLTGALSAEGPLTVFAPTNTAFEALATSLNLQVADLLDLPNLKDILLYHVASGQFAGADVSAAGSATTLEGSTVSAKVVGSDLVLNDAIKVIIGNLATSNGIIHVIDGVLLPPSN